MNINYKIIIAFFFFVNASTISAQTDGLDIEGKASIGGLVTLKTTTTGSSNTTNVTQMRKLSVDSKGLALVDFKGTPVVVGGFRPGSQSALFTAETNSSITRVRFIAHVDQSNVTNNGDTAAYIYGDFTIVFINGVGTINNLMVYDYAGNIKDHIENVVSGDIIIRKSFSLYTQNYFDIILRSDGRFGVGTESPTVSYIFEFMGGI
ncbi:MULTISPECIES: hypothetical protein [unclassified Flavobacterium]|uniref:hypothetical protein n=1 Tax=unclassified Flavobacterium TaxID=196869 RepID=UPI00057D9C71|nr:MULTISPECIES: hypothetical protein [unclassified Flavobacterium]KIA95659.1 hypothetical protein OA93_18105 [Flavobacterium sp. KMS]OUL62807.1 hypothetical protein B8T70_08135 [Flavobacterium sp. AJR]